MVRQRPLTDFLFLYIMSYQEKTASIVKQSNEVANPLTFAKENHGNIYIKFASGSYKVAFSSKTISAHGWGATIQQAFQNMLEHFEAKKEMYLRKRLLETIFAPRKKSHHKTVA